MRRENFYDVGDIVDDFQILGFHYNEYRQKVAECQCLKCGRLKNIIEGQLTRHRGTSHRQCGQFLKTKDPKFYRSWIGMKNRISNEKYYRYDRYGGRGLTCDYENFIDFYDDYYESYKKAFEELGPNIQVDRIDNDLGYVKGNIRWTTQEHQVRNQSKIRLFYAVSPDGTIYISNNQMRFCENHGLQAKQFSSVLSGRFRQTLGWQAAYKEQINSIDDQTCIKEMYY